MDEIELEWEIPEDPTEEELDALAERILDDLESATAKLLED